MSAVEGFDPFISATALAKLIADKQISPVEVAETYLKRIDSYNGAINAFVWRDDATTLAHAKAAEELVMSGQALPPFHGVPLPIKDLTAVAGQPNTRGAVAIDGSPQPVNDLVVDRFYSAGFVFMGRTNTPESGMLQVTENTRYGVTRNPWNLGRTSGGSSGGASAAVAAGLAPIAAASDGGGSIRMPASCAGLIGLKPSRGRVPVVSPGWEASSTPGFITRTVADTAASLQTICTPDPAGWLHAPALPTDFTLQCTRPSVPLRIGVMTDAPNAAEVSPSAKVATTEVAMLLESMGHTIVPVPATIVPAEIIEIYLYRVIAAALNTVPYSDEKDIEPFIRARMKLGQSIDSGEYVKSVSRLHQLSRVSKLHWQTDFDVLLTPTLATEVPPADFGLREANRLLDGSADLEAKMLAFTLFANVLGLPAVSLPAATDAAGLPVGVQLIANQFDELTLLRLANELEQHYRWELNICPNFLPTSSPA